MENLDTLWLWLVMGFFAGYTIRDLQDIVGRWLNARQTKRL